MRKGWGRGGERADIGQSYRVNGEASDSKDTDLTRGLVTVGFTSFLHHALQSIHHTHVYI